MGVGQPPDGFHILGDVHPRAAELSRDGDPEQPQCPHLVQDIVGNAIAFDQLRFGRNQPFPHIAVELRGKGLEAVLVHSSVMQDLGHVAAPSSRLRMAFSKGRGKGMGLTGPRQAAQHSAGAMGTA